MNEYLLPIGVMTVLILINGLFVAAEFGIAAAPRTRIQQLAEEGVTAARHVLATLRTPRLLNRYISTAQVGITLASCAPAKVPTRMPGVIVRTMFQCTAPCRW